MKKKLSHGFIGGVLYGACEAHSIVGKPTHIEIWCGNIVIAHVGQGYPPPPKTLSTGLAGSTL